MPSYTIRDISPELLARLRARAAQEGLPLSRAILAVLTTYADHGSSASHGARGGQVAAARMTAEARIERAKAGARARWGTRE